MSRAWRTLATGMREAVGLLVDDGAVALGVILAVVVAALLVAPLGSGEAVGWALFAMVWAALAVSLRRARPRS